MKSLILLTLTLLSVGCAQTGHNTIPSELGEAPDWNDFVRELDRPGPIEFERIVAADWRVPRSGVLNLKHERAKEAGLEDGPEPIQVYMYAVRHPDFGLFLIDTGVDHATATGSNKDMAASWLVRSAMKLEDLHVHIDTKTWLAGQDEPLAGVLLTHLHLDHSMGLPDIPDDVPVYTGPGEASDSKFANLFTRGTTNRTLRGKSALHELQPTAVPASPFDGIVDIFGDGTLLGIHIPGHTRGSMAFLLRTTSGPVLLTGDGSHTAWGWHHDVEAGTYNTDRDAAAESFHKLKRFADEHPTMIVHLGHQSHDHAATAAR